MEKTRQRLARSKRHSEQLARRALKEAGTRRAVSRALGRSESTISHEVTDRFHPDLAKAFTVLLNLIGYPGVDGRAFAEACAEAVELSGIILADDEVLIDRGLFLLEAENRIGYAEDIASLSGHGHAEALRKVASASAELASIIDEMAYRNVDLHEEYRDRAEVFG